MSTPDSNGMCPGLIEKLTSGQHLNDAEKDHLIECPGCMAEVVRHLQQVRERSAELTGEGRAASNNDQVHTRAEATKALEHGRRVFAREFGLSLSKD
jgi:hypothetical protein